MVMKLQLLLLCVAATTAVQAARVSGADAVIKEAADKARNGKKPNFVFILVRSPSRCLSKKLHTYLT
jgi:hypothetical protein